MIIFFIYQGTSSHTEMTLSGRGIKHMESYNTHGDHIVHIMIKMPVNMTEEQKELIKEYAYLEKSLERFPAGPEQERLARQAGFAEANHRSLVAGQMGVLTLRA